MKPSEKTSRPSLTDVNHSVRSSGSTESNGIANGRGGLLPVDRSNRLMFLSTFLDVSHQLVVLGNITLASVRNVFHEQPNWVRYSCDAIPELDCHRRQATGG